LKCLYVLLLGCFFLGCGDGPKQENADKSSTAEPKELETENTTTKDIKPAEGNVFLYPEFGEIVTFESNVDALDFGGKGEKFVRDYCFQYDAATNVVTQKPVGTLLKNTEDNRYYVCLAGSRIFDDLGSQSELEAFCQASGDVSCLRYLAIIRYKKFNKDEYLTVQVSTNKNGNGYESKCSTVFFEERQGSSTGKVVKDWYIFKGSARRLEPKSDTKTLCSSEDILLDSIGSPQKITIPWPNGEKYDAPMKKIY
jgi:hypothetical protein